MEPHELYFANLSWSQLQERLTGVRKLVLLFPVGATEAHGPHAPLATDVIISQGMSRRAARRLQDDPEMDALILPALPYTVTRYAAGFTGTIHVDEETIQNMIVDVCRSLIDQGFRYIVLVNNHFEPEHVQTLHRSIDNIEAATGVTVGFLDLTRAARARRLTEEFKKSECHAGQYETSLVLADHPELVDDEVRSTLPAVPVSLVDVIGQGKKEFREMGLIQAYNGRPAQASVAEGQGCFDILTEMLLEVIRDLVRGTGGRDQPGFYNRV